MSLQKNLFALATFFTLNLAVTGCAKHENAESGNEKFRTEEIAAKQGEVARVAVKEPEAKEPATYTATTAPASGTATTTTTTTTSSPANTNTATASSAAEKTVIKETTTVTTKTEEKKQP